MMGFSHQRISCILHGNRPYEPHKQPSTHGTDIPAQLWTNGHPRYMVTRCPRAVSVRSVHAYLMLICWLGI